MLWCELSLLSRCSEVIVYGVISVALWSLCPTSPLGGYLSPTHYDHAVFIETLCSTLFDVHCLLCEPIPYRSIDCTTRQLGQHTKNRATRCNKTGRVGAKKRDKECKMEEEFLLFIWTVKMKTLIIGELFHLMLLHREIRLLGRCTVYYFQIT